MADKELKIKIKAQDETKGTIASIEKGLGGLGDKVKSLVQGFLALEAVKITGAFFKSAIQESLNAERNFIQVGNALRNIGIDAGKVQPQVQQLIDSLSKKTGIKDDDISVAFARLIERTGNYKQATENLGLVLDFAKSKNVDYATAADTVSKSLAGSAKATALLQGVQGSAAAQNVGFAKTVNDISIAWDGFLQKVGKAITSGDSLTKSGNFVVDMLGDLGNWIEAHQADIDAFKDSITDLAHSFGLVVTEGAKVVRFFDKAASLLGLGSPGKDGLLGINKGSREAAERFRDLKSEMDGFGRSPNARLTDVTPPKTDAPKVGPHVLTDAEKKALEAAKKAFEEQIVLLTKASEINGLSIPDLDKLLTIRENTNKQLAKGNLTLKERVELLERQKSLETALGNVLGNVVPGVKNLPGKPLALKGFDLSIPPLEGVISPQAQKENDDHAKNLEHLNSVAQDVTTNVGAMQDAFLNMFAAIGSGEPVFASIAKAAKNALADAAKVNAQNEFAEGLKQLAIGIGNPAASAKAFASAAGHFEAAAAFGIVAGLAGGGSKGGKGGGSGVSQNTFDSNRDAASLPPTQIIITGGLINVNDPRQAQEFADAINTLTNRRVIVTGGN